MLRHRLFTLVMVGLAAMCRVALAQTPLPPLLETPVYDPEAKRYFALMTVVPDHGQYVGAEWTSAVQQAQRQVYKGARGRLAVVDSVEVHEFLLRTFHPQFYQNIWIGLRYMCGLHYAEWSDGRKLQPGSFQAWDKRWNQDPTAACTNLPDKDARLRDWAPVAYSPERTWIVKGQRKVYQWYYIEFPTGQP